MENINFSYFDSQNFNKVNIEDLLRNKKVLLISFTRPFESLTIKYAEYLESKLELYKQSVDEIYFVNFTHGNIFLAGYSNRTLFNKIPLLYNDGSLIEYLRTTTNRTSRDVTFLKTYWNFHAIFDNGKLVFFNDSPIEDTVKAAVKKDPEVFKKSRHTHRYITENPNLVLWVPSLLLNSNPVGYELEALKLLYYNTIWPSTGLDDYLLGKNTDSSV
jgi:peroxiredoxin